MLNTKSILVFLILLLDQAAHAWLTESDGYNIGVFMGSILGGVLLILLLFFILYYCWLRQVLFEYTDYRRQHGPRGHQSGAYYRKKPPPPDYTSRAGTYETRASPVPRPLPSVSGHGLPPRSTSPYGGGSGYPAAGTLRADSPQRTTYTRTVMRSSPSPTRARSTSPPVHLSRGPTPSGRVSSPTFNIQNREESPSRRQYHFDSSLESRHSPPAAHRYQPSGAVMARPDSGMSSHSRVLVNSADAGAPSLNYQSTFQQRVVSSAGKSQRPAYVGSSV